MEKNNPEETRKSVEAFLSSAGIETLDSDPGKYMFKDGYNGTIFLAWKANRTVIISGLSKDQAGIADRYTNEILK
jgi:hypothetical protein